MSVWRRPLIAGRTPQGYLNAAAAGERFFLAANDVRVVAFGSGQNDELLSLYVHPDFPRQGAGSALFAACCKDAERAGGAAAVIKSPLGAEAFYARCGYAVAGPGSVLKREAPVP